MSLRKNFSWMTAGRAIYAASQWLLLITIARLTTPEVLGDFTYALAVTSPIIIFAQLNMRAFMATDAKGEFLFWDYFATRLAAIALALVAISIIAISSNLTSTAALLIVLVGSYKAIEAISDLFYGVLQQHEAMSQIAISVATHGISSVLIMTFFVAAFNNAIFGAIGIVILWLVILLAYDIPASKIVLLQFGPIGRVRVWEVIKSTFPLGLVLAIMSLRINLTVYFIKAELGTEQVGYYSAIAYFMIAGNLITGSLVQTAAPRLARHYHQGQSSEFHSLLNRLLVIAALIGVAGVAITMAFGSEILWLFYGSEYEHLGEVLVWIMVAAAAGYISQFFGMSLTVARKFRYQLFSNFAGVITVLVLSYYFIPSRGLAGGAIALLGGAVITLLFNAIAAWFKIDVDAAYLISQQRLDSEQA